MHNRVARERVCDAGFVRCIDDPVRNDDHRTIAAFAGYSDSPLGNIDRTRSWFDNDDDDVDGVRRQSCEGADAGFEVSDDDGRGGTGGTELGGAEQLLGRKTTSGSTGFWVLNSAHHRKSYTVRRVASEPIDELVPARRVLGSLVIECLANGSEALRLGVTDAQ